MNHLYVQALKLTESLEFENNKAVNLGR